MRTILIADDEANARSGLKKALESDFIKVDTAENGKAAYSKLQIHEYDILITDIRMPEMDGMTLLQKAKQENPNLEVIVLTAYGTIEMAVKAIREFGAYNYLTKPVNIDELDHLVNQILEKKQIELEIQYHREQKETKSGLQGIVGQSQAIQHVIDQIKQIAPTKATVLITGETGTGKELVARAIHTLSPRNNRLFVPIHCAALSENLLESELFGHEKGAFTGAIKQRKGRFEQAHKGTVFLDEISEISNSIQVKLLRVLQEREFERVGGSETISVDIRIIAATNMDLQKLVDEDKFREDLFYRLKVVSLHIPPLRERLDDIPLLVDNFVNFYAKENNKGAMTVAPEVIEIFQQYNWPGNVRQLQGVIESMVILARSNKLTKDNIPHEIRNDANHGPTTPVNKKPVIEGDTTLADIEKQVILDTLEKYGGNRTKTAEILGIGRRTLIRKLHEYGATKDIDENDEE